MQGGAGEGGASAGEAAEHSLWKQPGEGEVSGLGTDTLEKNFSPPSLLVVGLLIEDCWRKLGAFSCP